VVAKEIQFIHCFLKDMHIEVILQIVVKTDNVGSIFISENAWTGIQTGI
jgi:hypothetical protein